MCVIVAKKRGFNIPTKKELKICWRNNPDGAGFMYNDGDNVYIFKGFLKFKEFYKKLQEVNKKENLTNKDLIIHFRIATSGGINAGCTHPFPITNNYDSMKQTRFKTSKAIAHNGIISGYGDDKNNISDTMEYIAKILYNIHDLENSTELLNELAIEKNSRFATMLKDKMILSGEWIKDGNYYYSNYSYIDYSSILKNGYYIYDDITTSDDNYYDLNMDNDDDDITPLYDYCDYCGDYTKITKTDGRILSMQKMY